VSAEAMGRKLVGDTLDMLIELNYLRVRLSDGSEHYVLTPDIDTNTWHVSKSLLKAIKAKEVCHD
jgi:hypothetical protein